MMLPAALRTNRGTGEEGQRRNNNNKHITTPMMTSNPKKKNNHHDHKKDKHGKNKNKNKKKQARTNNGGMTPQPQQTTTTTNTTLTTVDPAKIEVHNISIQHGFKNRVPLPPINVWSRVLDKGSFLTAVLSVCVKRKAFFFDRRLATGFFTCVLSRQGHLVVYTEDGNEGFALNLRKASKLHIEFNKEKALPPPGEPPKRTCTVTAKWRFGSIVLQFQDRKMAEWCYAIVAATALDQGFPPAPRFVQSLGTGLLRVPPAEILMQPTTIPNDAAHQEHPKKMLQAHPIREETTKKKNEEAVTKEGKKKQRDEEQEIPVGAARKLKDTAGLAPTSLSEDFPASIISDSNAEDMKEDGLADSKGVNSAEEDHKLDGSGLEEEDNDHIGNEPSSDRQEDEEEAEYWQRPESVGEEKTGEKKIIEEQQKEEEKAKKPPPPTPLKRRVTFSSQKTIIDKEEEKNANSTSGGPAPAMAESDSETEPAWESFEEKTPEYRATTSAGLAKYQRHPRTGFTPAAAETTEQSTQQPNSFRTRRAPFDFRRIDDIDDEW